MLRILEFLFVKPGRWFVRRVEVAIIVPLAEGVMRAWYHLDPKVYSKELRIKKVTDGERLKPSKKYAIFVLYTKEAVPSFVETMLRVLRSSDFNLVIVSNNDLSDAIRQTLCGYACLIIERANLGRDFGAYKDGILHVIENLGEVDRLIIFNDSMFFFESGISDLLVRLDHAGDFVGITEVLEHHYHVQSYMLSFGAAVLSSPWFLRFWRKYRPISTRRWSIHKGEVLLTRRLTKAGFRPHVLFQASELAAALKMCTVRQVVEALRLLPRPFREAMYSEFDDVIGDKKEREVSIKERQLSIETISQGIHIPGAEHTLIVPEYETGIVARLRAVAREARAMEDVRLDILISKLVEMIAERNQSHVGGFLFMKHLGLPLIKRDLVYREVYSLEEVDRILRELNEPLREDVLSDLRRGGSARYLKGFRRLLHNYGSI